MGAPQLRAEFKDDHFDFETLRRNRFITGSPEECIEQIDRHRQELGITHLIFRIQKKGMPHRHVLEVLRVLAERVIPFCRA
jgi:alkanesulfonate monooxygenase SsuD/methylene tetrahydromethanopterin reductase-like flavin-dependent oxidoreductase (luciferase family)